MSNSRWAPKAAAVPFVPQGPTGPAALPTPSSSSVQPAQQSHIPPSLHEETSITTMAASGPSGSVNAEAPKKVNTWDKYKYKPELDVPISFNESAEGRQRPSRLPAPGTGPKHDAKGLTGAAASRWAPKHVVDQALRQKEAEQKATLSSEDEAKTGTSTPSIAAPSSQTSVNEASRSPQLPKKPFSSTAEEPVAAGPISKEDPLARVNNVLLTTKAENAKKSPSAAETTELPSLLSRLSVPDSESATPTAPSPKTDDVWMVGSSFKPQEPVTPPRAEQTGHVSTPSGGMNWADEDEDDEEDLKALMAREWGAASVAKVEEKHQSLVRESPKEPARSQPVAPRTGQGVSIRGQASRPQQVTPAANPNQGLELFPGPSSQPPPREGVTSPRRARPQVATKSDAFARLSRGFLGAESATGGAGARTRGKRAGKELIKEPGT